jgi:ABC-2 type transport system ATP-binding protein
MVCDNAIEVRGLAKRYRSVQALEDLTLQVRRGDVFGFLGPNGAGKTTSVKLLVGLVHPSAGTGTLLGYPLGDRRARSRLGYLPELFRYPDWLTAREVLEFHAHICGNPKASQAVSSALDLVGLRPRADDRVATFSKGMQQRLGLAVALLGDPELVILDEPTSALDPAGRLEVREIVRELRSRGTTVFLNSHLLTEVEQVCDRITIVTRGRVVAEGTIAEILGEGSGVRVRARANGTPLENVLERFGTIEPERDALVVRGVGLDSIPRLVDALVGSGAEVYGIEPLSATLEDRFLELTRERET